MENSLQERVVCLVGYYNTFVVKIWCNDHGQMARGHVQHVSSKDYIYFLGLNDMNDFIISHVKLPSKNSVNLKRMQPGLMSNIGDIDE